MVASNMRLRSGIKTESAEGVQPEPEIIDTPRKVSTPKSSNASPAKRGRPPTKRSSSPLKRKISPVENLEKEAEQAEPRAEDEDSADEIGDAQLEGALSASEDEESDAEPSVKGDESDESDAEKEDDSFGEEEHDDDALHSDDIPSDEDESSFKIPPLKDGQEPGLDPPDMDDGGEDLRNYRVETDANGNERYVYDEIDPAYDSDDTDAGEPVNTIGDIDLKFYDSYPHIGYDINGKKIMRPAAGEALDALLESIEVPKGWTGLIDPATGKPMNLTRDELELIKKIQTNELPDGYNPYPVCIALFILDSQIF